MKKKIKSERKIIEEIVSRITKDFKIKDIILFGSHAWGGPDQHSDIDLVIILDEVGIAKNYWDKVERRLEVSKSIRDIRKKVPIDLLVYTKDEWNRLIETDSSFLKQVSRDGIHLI